MTINGAMDQDQSLMWHGPAWFAGRASPVDAGVIPGRPPDIDVWNAFQSSLDVPKTLPSVVLVRLGAIPANIRSGFFEWLTDRLAGFDCEVPVVWLADGQEHVPDRPRAHAVVDDQISAQALFQRICFLQRSLVRFDEARLRRLVFGRVPRYGTAPHNSGTSGLLVIGLGNRFVEFMQAGGPKVEVIGAFNQAMAEDYLSRRGFDAVILDAPLSDSLENLRQLRMDARYAMLPVLVFAQSQIDAGLLFDAGATDVVPPDAAAPNLQRRLSVAIRAGKRRRLSDRMLAESHTWLMQTLNDGGLAGDKYAQYLDNVNRSLGLRGLTAHELHLLPEAKIGPSGAAHAPADHDSTLLSIADATSREEDLICVVKGIGPVAVLKSERGKARLQARVHKILSHTIL
ncbi:MAG: hypothetical protein JJ902_09985 [Roseibium sp.]|nr:hypothetical protein [Roseibium sp.]